MIERKLELINKLGLHARAAAKVVKLANQFSSKIILTHEQQEAEADSIMALMMLACAKGAILTATSEGEDEEVAIDALETLFLRRFGEDE